MMHSFNQFGIALSKIEKRHIQLFLILLTLGLLVLGAGAPEIGGGSLPH